MASSQAEILRDLTLRSADPIRIDRLQVMIVAIGEAMGFDDSELWAWRTAVVVGEAGQSLESSEFEVIDREWLRMEQEFAFRQCCVVAEFWNSAWVEGESPLKTVVIDRAGALVGDEVLVAFEQVADVIVPLRFEPVSGGGFSGDVSS